MPNTMKRLSATLLASLVLSGAKDLSAQQAQTAAGNLLIKNATVLTVTKGTLQNSDILVRNGKITQIGQNLTEIVAYGTAVVLSRR